MAAGSLKTPRMIVMLFGHLVVGVAENEGCIPNVFRVIHGDRGRGAITKRVRIDSAAKRVSGLDEDPSGNRLYGYAEVPAETPGVVIHDDWDALGMRASGSNSVSFEDVHLPASALRGGFPIGGSSQDSNGISTCIARF